MFKVSAMKALKAELKVGRYAYYRGQHRVLLVKGKLIIQYNYSGSIPSEMTEDHVKDVNVI